MKQHGHNGMAALLLEAIDDTDLTVFYQDRDLVYRWMESPPHGWDVAKIIGRGEDDVLPPEAAATVAAAKRAVLETGEKGSSEVDMVVNGERRCFDLMLHAHRDDDGTIIGVLGIAVETTEKLRKAHALRELLAEVSHRSRNLLAVVQSIANHSFRNHVKKPVLDRFQERLQSLAISLDLIVSEGWDGARLKDLVSAQLGPYTHEHERITVSGADRMLVPHAALHLGLAFQELAAVMDEQSSDETPRVEVAVRAEGSAENAPVELLWRQAGRDWEQPNDDLSTRTLRRVVPAALGGTCDLSSDGEGRLQYSVTIPTKNFEK